MKRVKFLTFLLPALVFLIVLAFPVEAETKTLSVSRDSFANQAYPDKNYGTLPPLIISNKFTDRLVYLQFENPDLPTGAILDQAVLKIYVYERNYADRAKLNVGPITGDWDENTLTWNNKPTINQTQAIEAEVSLTADGWKEISLTHLVRQWHQGTMENKGIFLYPLGFLYGTAETEFALTFKSKEAGDTPPSLEIEYHLEPEPTPTPTITPSPQPSPEITPGQEATISPVPLTPTPESSEKSTPEATEEAGLVLSLTTGQTIILGLILLALVGAVLAFAAYFQKQPSKKKAEKKKSKKKETEKETENKKEESEEEME